MKTFCHYGCYMKGCMGLDREDAITELLDRRPEYIESELEAKSDAELNQLLEDMSDVDYGPPHIRKI